MEAASYESFNLDVHLNWDFFSLHTQFFYYKYFIRSKFSFFEKIRPSHSLDYSGSHFKNKKNFINLLLKSSLRGGNKLLMLKHFNLFNDSFYFLFNNWNSFLNNKFSTYNVYYEISVQNPRFFNINLLLKSILDLNESIFNLRVVKYTKSQRKFLKPKKKFFYEVVYLPKNKRFKNLLKIIHRHAHQYNNYTYFERLLMSFCNSFFLQKNSLLYNRKIYMCKNAFVKKQS